MTIKMTIKRDRERERSRAMAMVIAVNRLKSVVKS